jgi:tape measure domain-containing protein
VATEVGAVYVSVMPTTSGFSREMDRGITGGFDSAATKGESGLRRMLTRVAAAGAAILATIGLGRLIRDTVSLGVQYNVLEQTSRAAFKTILGSGEAASAMMDEIKQFASTSPFPRQAFIEATQQMLAFGFATEDVVPILGAVQDAVAAAGGASSDIGEIVRVLSLVQSTGKITAETLNQLGARGINAAKLIAEQMGTTEGAIRDSITKGTLDAGLAMDALRKGMDASFGGAAENVKETFVGAVDRIKGATRDIASALVAPFVDPNGGGFAVDWANKFADVLRNFEKSPAFDILTAKLTAFGQKLDPIVAKAAELLGILLNDGWGSFRAELDSMATSSPSLAAFLGVFDALAPLMPALADAIVKMTPALLELIPKLADLVIEILPRVVELVGILVPVIAAAADYLTTEFIPAIGGLMDGLSNVAILWDDNVLNAWSDSALAGNYGTVIKDLMTFATDWDREWVKFFGEVGVNINNFGQVVGASFEILVGYFTSLPSQILAALGSLGNLLVAPGRDMLDGFVKGIGDMASKVVTAAAKVAGDAVDTVKRLLGIKSPSRVFRYEVGQMIGEGMILGVEDKAGGMEKAIQQFASPPSLSSTGGGGSIYVQNPFTGEYLLAQVGGVAASAITAADSSAQLVTSGRRR